MIHRPWKKEKAIRGPPALKGLKSTAFKQQNDTTSATQGSLFELHFNRSAKTQGTDQRLASHAGWLNHDAADRLGHASTFRAARCEIELPTRLVPAADQPVSQKYLSSGRSVVQKSFPGVGTRYRSTGRRTQC